MKTMPPGRNICQNTPMVSGEPIGFMEMPPDFAYKDVIRKGRPKHEKYDDFWRRHPPMPASRRAKIFAPFDALAGFDEEIAAKEILYTQKRELSEDQKEDLDRKLARLLALTAGSRGKGPDRSSITIEYFEACTDPDSEVYGSGGRYETLTGTVLKIDTCISRTIRILTDDGERCIPLTDVTSIDGDIFD